LPNEALEIELSAPLSDFIFGHVRMATAVRRLLDGKTEEVQLACRIHPGMEEGTRLVFPRLGHSDQPGSDPADAIVTVLTQPHLLYARYRSNLVFTQNFTLVEALVGRKFKVPLMDGRVLPMHLTDIAAPGYTICISGEGVPVGDDVHSEVLRKGDLFIEFNVEWPINRSDEIWADLVTELKAQ
jgi:DnaJ-class molecular chaperone